MEDLRSNTLAQIVTKNYRAAVVFEQYNIDFCCKGKRTLGQACSEKGIEWADMEQALTRSGATRENEVNEVVLGMTPGELTVYIEQNHHRYVREEMPLIEGYLLKLATKHGDRHPELYEVLSHFSDIKDELEPHMKKEEMVLFPRIREAEQYSMLAGSTKPDSAYLGGPIHVMETEHDTAGTLMASIRNITSGYTVPADGCTTYKLCYASLQAFEMDLHRHVHLENNVLFPKAMKLVK